MNYPKTSAVRQAAMSLIELLVAMAIFSAIILLLFSILGTSQTAWANARDQLNQFQESRSAFETMTRRITDSVLNTYWGYEYPNGDTQQTPTKFTRKSELHFVSGTARDLVPGDEAAPGHAIFFHGPFGLHDQTNWTEFSALLNGWGYFIQYGEGHTVPGFFPEGSVNQQRRFRLMELRIPADELQTYSKPESEEWFQKGIADKHLTVVAENVIALIISPKAPEGTLSNPTQIAPNYTYNTRGYLSSQTGYAIERSKHQLPPLLQISMVVLDETSAIRLADQNSGSTPPDFGIGSLFQDADKYDVDMSTLEEKLIDLRLRYRIFTSTIRLRNARWSENLPAEV